MVNYPVFFLLLSTWTWDIFLTLRVNQVFYLIYVLAFRPSKSYRVGGALGFDCQALALKPKPKGLGLMGHHTT